MSAVSWQWLRLRAALQSAGLFMQETVLSAAPSSVIADLVSSIDDDDDDDDNDNDEDDALKKYDKACSVGGKT